MNGLWNSNAVKVIDSVDKKQLEEYSNKVKEFKSEIMELSKTKEDINSFINNKLESRIKEINDKETKLSIDRNEFEQYKINSIDDINNRINNIAINENEIARSKKNIEDDLIKINLKQQELNNLQLDIKNQEDNLNLLVEKYNASYEKAVSIVNDLSEKNKECVANLEKLDVEKLDLENKSNEINILLSDIKNKESELLVKEDLLNTRCKDLDNKELSLNDLKVELDKQQKDINDKILVYKEKQLYAESLSNKVRDLENKISASELKLQEITNKINDKLVGS